MAGGGEYMEGGGYGREEGTWRGEGEGGGEEERERQREEKRGAGHYPWIPFVSSQLMLVSAAYRQLKHEACVPVREVGGAFQLAL